MATLIARVSRYGIFSGGKRIPPGETTTNPPPSKHDADLASKIEENAEKKESTKVIQIHDEEKVVQKKRSPSPAQASYFGYLSGVVHSIWNNPATQKVLEVGQGLSEVVQSEPVKERKPKVIIKKVSRTEVVARTKNLIKQLFLAETTSSKLFRTQELCKHLMEFPASRFVLVQENTDVITHLLKQRDTASDDGLREESRICLSLCGYVDPPKAKGVRILSIDGGGTRGIMALEVLGELEKNLGGKLVDHFDLITGVSTGAIMCALLGAHRMTVSEAKVIYMELSRQLFNQTRLSGVSGLFLSHAYYNTKKWVEIIKNVIGEDKSVIDVARHEGSVKIAIISCIVNAMQLQPYVFRNYEHPAGRDSHFRGGTKYKLWQAIQASAAAPGYFEEVLLDTLLHQDGGVLANNPTSIALHEARLLWPNDPIQCVVSVGNGRSVVELEVTSTITNTGIQDKITKIIDSATDTELVHMSMTDLLEPKIYFRLNPYMSFPYTLDEVDRDRLEQMNRDAKAYVRRNRLKIRGAALQLSKTTSVWTMANRKFTNFKNQNGLYKP